MSRAPDRATRLACLIALAAVWAATGCQGQTDGEPVAVTSAGAAAQAEPDPSANADGDCMTDAEELAKGTDPAKADTDGDGVSDCDEIACVSDPTDPTEKCYSCGWSHKDPGDLVSNGAALGDVVDNVVLPDQCGEDVSLWDFHGQYFIMYLTAAW